MHETEESITKCWTTPSGFTQLLGLHLPVELLEEIIQLMRCAVIHMTCSRRNSRKTGEGGAGLHVGDIETTASHKSTLREGHEVGEWANGQAPDFKRTSECAPHDGKDTVWRPSPVVASYGWLRFTGAHKICSKWFPRIRSFCHMACHIAGAGFIWRFMSSPFWS